MRHGARLGHAMSEAIDPLEKLGSEPWGEKVLAAVERASKTIAFRIAGIIDRRTSIILAAALMLADAIGAAVGYAVGTAEAARGPLAICWQRNGARACVYRIR